mgnify:CR=1 FL=1
MILTYLKRFYLLVAAIGAAILFASYYNSVYTHDYKGAVEAFEAAFHEEEQHLDHVLEFTNTRLNSGKITPHWENLNGQEGVNIHIYRNDSLIFWNTNQLPIIRFADIHFPAEGLVKLQNGWYYAKMRSDNDFTVCVSFLIHNDYAYENQHLVNGFSPQLPLEFDAEIVPDKDIGYPIKNAKGEYVCSIDIAKEQPITEEQSVILLVLLLLTVILAVAVLYQFIVKQKLIWSWVSIAAILLIRYLSLNSGWFSFMEETEAMNPALYGVNDWLPNFLEYSLHIVVLVYVLGILRIRVDGWKPSKSGLIANYT